MVINRFAKILLSYPLYYTGFLTAFGRITKRNPKIFVFMYHKLCDKRGEGLPFKIFRRQIMFLKKNFDIKSLEEAASIIKNKTSFNKAIAVITFDDGYLSFFELAYSFLTENNIPATVFLTTNCADGKDFIWTDRIGFMVNTSGNKRLSAEKIKQSLKNLSEPEKEERLKKLTKTLNAKIGKRVEEYMITWPIVKKMDNPLISFGAHTVSHPILSKITPEVAEREIAESKRKIESEINKNSSIFCYPNGQKEDFNKNISEIVQKNDFVCACSAMEGINTIHSDLYALKRVSTTERHLPIFAARLFYRYATK